MPHRRDRTGREVNVMTFRTAIDGDKQAASPADDLTVARPGPLVAASAAIAESRRARAEAADELAAWAAILHQAA
jgi:hypothetical protein